MKKLFILLATMVFAAVSAGAQQPLDISSGYDDQGNAMIGAELRDNGIYTVTLKFDDVVNFNTVRVRQFRVSSSGTLVSLKPVDPYKSSNHRIGWTWVYGSVDPKKVDPEFVYRLPFSTAKDRQAHELYNFVERHWGKDDHNVDFTSFQFTMNRGDTIYAARKGTVIRVVDKHEPVRDLGTITMDTQANELYVEHADGTIARYGVLEKGSICVKQGDVVFPCTPVGLAGTFDGEIYQLRLSLYYQTDNMREIVELDNYNIVYHYIDPVFATSKGETQLTEGILYTPVVSDELTQREMTKREIKTLNKQQ
jgi:hypothetical protein